MTIKTQVYLSCIQSYTASHSQNEKKLEIWSRAWCCEASRAISKWWQLISCFSDFCYANPFWRYLWSV